MKKNNLYDLLIIIFISIGLSCFPFNYFVKSEWLIIVFQILAQLLIFAFKCWFVRNKSELEMEFRKPDLRNSLLFLPCVIVCFSNYFYLPFCNGPIRFSFTYLQILQIVLTLCVAFNEEIIFRLLLIDSLEKTSNFKAVLISAGAFALCHITTFLSTFNPVDLLQIVYTFFLGLLLAIIFVKTKSVFPCIIFHFLFNVFNFVLFECFILTNINYFYYIICNAGIVLIASLYVSYLLFFSNFIRNVEEKTETPA